ncbi:hypothetical protein RBA71_20815 [Brenneria goodwinii]|uniref:alpha/beta hydrolase family protein n=1 Tax=Brenneria goodwinii TaxID=1109412 RepID=UPI0036E85911
MKKLIFTPCILFLSIFSHFSLAETEGVTSSFLRLTQSANNLSESTPSLDKGIPGVIYKPLNPESKSKIAIFVMHAAADYLSFSPCTELAKRGYTVLCANNNTQDYDQKILAVKSGVQYLRNLEGIEKIVLFGHSGGSGLMSAYQNIAENGLKACQNKNIIFPCSDELSNLPPADGLMLIDPNWGDATMMLLSIDPAVTVENSGLKLDPSLNLFDEHNGFNKKGAHYSKSFVRRYQHAQVIRYNKILKFALSREQKIKQGKGLYQDDEPLIIPGGDSQVLDNKLYPQDVSLMSRTIKPWPLIHPNESEENTLIHSVRPPMNLKGSLTGQMHQSTASTTILNYLKNFAIRVNDNFSYDEASIHGVDWSSNYSTSAGNVKGISVPLLTMGMTGSWEYLSVETIYQNAKSSDKKIAFVDGANHLFQTCTQCEKSKGQYGDTANTLFNYIDKWISFPGRFDKESITFKY